MGENIFSRYIYFLNKNENFNRSTATNSLISLKIKNTPPTLGIFTPQPIRIDFLSNSRWQNLKEYPNLTINNGDLADIAKRPVSKSLTSY